ncbi:MAG: carbon-nitrogen hydrolase family protein [Planctomycetes bacterium]|nr:carbon-nitrogen hydrolase family protein [Planctomycetota bacterium]
MPASKSVPDASDWPRSPTTSHLPPRKVIVGTSHRSFWGAYPGVDARLKQLTGLLDRMDGEARQAYGRGVDLAVLPEMCVTGGMEGDAAARALPYSGAVREAFSNAARKLNSYVVLPMILQEEDRVSNAALLIGRNGELEGLYRKRHLAVRKDEETFEQGTVPGAEVPVFSCDFGKLGLQICFDDLFDIGWQDLARQGAELVVWPTFRPGTVHALARAHWHRYYIVSATWGRTAHVIDPTGHIAAQAPDEQPTVVHELDLSYARIVSWAGRPGEDGDGFKQRFGARVGYRCHFDEGCHLYWSNDPAQSIGAMAREIGAVELESEVARTCGLYRQAGVRGYA